MSNSSYQKNISSVNEMTLPIITSSMYFTGTECPKNPKPGMVFLNTDTNQMQIYDNDKWTDISSYRIDSSNQTNDITTVCDTCIEKHKKTKKIIPHPVSCEKCDALLDSYVCKHCGAEYPEYEYIIEEEIY